MDKRGDTQLVIFSLQLCATSIVKLIGIDTLCSIGVHFMPEWCLKVINSVQHKPPEVQNSGFNQLQDLFYFCVTAII